MTPKQRVFSEFAARVAKRLDAGKREYGDSSFRRPRAELLDEVQEELLDVCGWSYILWIRLERLRAKLAQVEPGACDDDGPEL